MRIYEIRYRINDKIIGWNIGVASMFEKDKRDFEMQLIAVERDFREGIQRGKSIL